MDAICEKSPGAALVLSFRLVHDSFRADYLKLHLDILDKARDMLAEDREVRAVIAVNLAALLQEQAENLPQELRGRLTDAVTEAMREGLAVGTLFYVCNKILREDNLKNRLSAEDRKKLTDVMAELLRHEDKKIRGEAEAARNTIVAEQFGLADGSFLTGDFLAQDFFKAAGALRLLPGAQPGKQDPRPRIGFDGGPAEPY
jgi:hypothetical protein